MIYIDTPAEIKNDGIGLMASMCGKRWEQMCFPAITTADEVEFRLVNPHKHGNKEAYREALSSLFITPMDNIILEIYLKPYMKPFEMVGYALLIVALVLLGASFSAFVFKSSVAKRLFKVGITAFFMGGYTILDIMMVYFRDELLVVKTYGSQLCLMLAVFFMGVLVCDLINEKYKRIAEIVIGVSAVANGMIILLATIGKVLLYDTQFFWRWVQCIISFVLIVLCVLELGKDKKKRIELISYIAMYLAFLLDLVGVGYHAYWSGLLFKGAFIIMLLVFLFLGAKQVVLDHQASIKNIKLKEELEKNRITIMLSQIQPHFLYNSLTSVMDLCDSNPKQAKAAIADFADYLRGNLASLRNENLITFSTELAHIEKYLKLEQLRFQDELKVIYDIRVRDFMLPALSVQPLVENAVKHGVGQKIGGGTVSVHTSEEEHEYIICITDDGVGFIEGEYADESDSHVGIENTRKRLQMMLNARLEIESIKGEGTRVCIRIPKG
jgi:two-component sensor histidine kinase